MMSAALSSGRKRVVVFISGGGSNMVSLAKACQAKDFPAEIACVISDKASAGGLEKARDLGIPTLVFERKTYASKAEHEGAILAALGEIAPDIICLAGYMRLISGDFIAPYEGRIINIHPSLLPLFPGLHTHQRAIDSGMKISGCTVHFVTEGMDEGPTIAQGAVPVLSDDTADTLAARILTVEHQLYPLALKLLADGKVRMEGGKTIFASSAIKSERESIISAS
ncbi:phosphoribosylglycinamide formyltransferase [Agrobacterium fabrum]|jgi:phosphoribosylglycinamide formyltransferase 1|uniref:Phosphoribosylglycinamide formyltransferase n=1 Tax=Agrobacterium fabrum TaxID=1176649 RepID=A0A7Z7BJS5_9HYPH|nr:phosphoribosylglycinamide formyltransferase [Agrobacterium fabrum]MCR6722681.1 phosphoribosylglycinamide formyltransferase [Agrobacterium fabrum]WCK77116.1 phosphoribosylglycinamide formyltransferase [Agrobacterium fabrum]WIE28199.1 phosphoribosylglycinamide formyltransferase [Agrobacterium fabrum]WIE44157.1 phosphoribosylglycinamide formyltransferase [Agrobacterium fabrum]CUX19583.1 phosphoribosylglycinamide formyltransferase (GART) (GAR transformylase) (5'-phosphoribosylglycinamide transf